MKKAVVKASGIAGKGLYANRNFRKGETVGVCRGKLYTSLEVERSPLPEHHFMQVDWDTYMLVKPPACYTNHSCEPNTGIKNSVKLVALRKIAKGEEITVDYDTLEYDWSMKCGCSSKNCRGAVRGFKYLSPELKKKYEGFISDYLLENPPEDVQRPTA